jgi:hypothetical protein
MFKEKYLIYELKEGPKLPDGSPSFSRVSEGDEEKKLRIVKAFEKIKGDYSKLVDSVGKFVDDADSRTTVADNYKTKVDGFLAGLNPDLVHRNSFIVDYISICKTLVDNPELIRDHKLPPIDVNVLVDLHKKLESEKDRLEVLEKGRGENYLNQEQKTELSNIRTAIEDLKYLGNKQKGLPDLFQEEVFLKKGVDRKIYDIKDLIKSEKFKIPEIIDFEEEYYPILLATRGAIKKVDTEDDFAIAPYDSRGEVKIYKPKDDKDVIDIPPTFPREPKQNAIGADSDRPAFPREPKQKAIGADPDRPVLPREPQRKAIGADPDRPVLPREPQRKALTGYDLEEPVDPPTPEEKLIGRNIRYVDHLEKKLSDTEVQTMIMPNLLNCGRIIAEMMEKNPIPGVSSEIEYRLKIKSILENPEMDQESLKIYNEFKKISLKHGNISDISMLQDISFYESIAKYGKIPSLVQIQNMGFRPNASLSERIESQVPSLEYCAKSYTQIQSILLKHQKELNAKTNASDQEKREADILNGFLGSTNAMEALIKDLAENYREYSAQKGRKPFNQVAYNYLAKDFNSMDRSNDSFLTSLPQNSEIMEAKLASAYKFVLASKSVFVPRVVEYLKPSGPDDEKAPSLKLLEKEKAKLKKAREDYAKNRRSMSKFLWFRRANKDKIRESREEYLETMHKYILNTVLHEFPASERTK